MVLERIAFDQRSMCPVLYFIVGKRAQKQNRRARIIPHDSGDISIVQLPSEPVQAQSAKQQRKPGNEESLGPEHGRQEEKRKRADARHTETNRLQRVAASRDARAEFLFDPAPSGCQGLGCFGVAYCVGAYFASIEESGVIVNIDRGVF